MCQTQTAEQVEEVLTAGDSVRRIERDEAGQLVVHLEGRDEPIVDARVLKCFPWTVPDGYLSVRNPDGKEVVLLRTLDELNDDSRQVVEAELREKMFNPKIHRILKFRHEFGVTSITAETDRGEVSFQVRSRDDVRVLSEDRALFRDADGNTYELPDLSELDAASRKQLMHYF
ncbi:MAG: DUF1854 domain-containing protein [Phycisphaerae bacterium]